MPPRKSKRTPAPPAPPAIPTPPAPPAPTNIPTPAYSGQMATVDGMNSNLPEPIPIPPAPAPTSTHLPAPVPDPASIPITNPGAGGRSRSRGGPKRRVGEAAEAEASGDSGAPKKTKKAAASSSGGGSAAGKEDTAGGGVEDVSDIHLDGEEADKVPVYDTCDEVRRKLTAYLRREGVTQAALLRVLHAELRGGKKTSRLQSSQLARFLQMKGANTGNTSALFYASYVYFEKLRVKQGKPKSKHREEMERIWRKDGGFDIETPSSRGYFCGPGEYPSIDQYGRLLINGKVCH